MTAGATGTSINVGASEPFSAGLARTVPSGWFCARFEGTSLCSGLGNPSCCLEFERFDTVGAAALFILFEYITASRFADTLCWLEEIDLARGKVPEKVNQIRLLGGNLVALESFGSVLVLKGSSFQAERSRMLRLIEADLASTGKPHLRDRAPACFLNVRALDALFRE